MRGTSLQAKIIFVGAFLLLIPTLMFSLFVYFRTTSIVEETSKVQFVQTAYSMSSMLNLSLTRQLGLIDNIARDPVILSEALSGQTVQTRKKLADYFDKMKDGLEDIGTFNRDGILRTDGTDGSKIGIDISDRDYFLKVRKGQHVISQLVNSKATGRPVFTICSPVFSKSKVFIGGVIAVMKADYLVEYVLSMKLGKTGYAFLVNNQGDLLIHPTRKDLIYRNVKTVWDLEGFIEKLHLSPGGAMEYQFEGKNKFCGFSKVPITGWYLVVTQDKNESMALAYKNVTYTIVATFFFILAGLGFLVFYANHISSPVQTSLVRLNSAVNQADEAFIITDSRCRLLFYNLSATKHIEGTPVLDSPFKLKDMDTDTLASILNEVKKEGSWNGRIEQRIDATPRNVDISIALATRGKKNHDSFLLTGRDITAELQLQKEILQRRKMDAIGTLAGGIAHDFNNILSGILGYVDLAGLSLASDGLSPEKVQKLKEYILQIEKASLRAADLVAHIMAFSRRSEQKAKHISLKYLVEDTLKLVRASLPSTIEIKKKLKSTASIFADPSEIHQVLMNLCTNAGYAMTSKGGTLEIDLEEMSSDQVAALYSDTAVDSYLRLKVSDTGEGISPNVIDKIFDPFFTTKPQGEGTGMGLSTVHGIVKKLEGELAVFSEVGRGTTITIYLPVAAIEEMPSDEDLTCNIQGGHEHILMVDDEIAITTSKKQLLEKLGYKVTAYNDSYRALNAFKQMPGAFDLILADYTMPQMVGLELALEAQKIRADIPVIICSGNKTIVQDISQLTNVTVLNKPAQIRELTTQIRNALDVERKRSDNLP